MTRAMDALANTCSSVGRNSACYGNNNIKAEANGGAALKFNAPGDQTNIQNIRALSTSPMDEKAGTWGLSVMKLQANLPDTMPGQNVTFLVFGDTTVENASGDMKAFYFTSGLGSPECKEAPRDGIVVRSPKGMQSTFTVNGAQITMGSTIVLRAERNKSMSIQLIEGSALVTASGGTQVLTPGQVTIVTLGGANGMTAVSVPSQPVVATIETSITVLVNLTIKFDVAATPGVIIIVGTPGATVAATTPATVPATMPATLAATSSATQAATTAATVAATSPATMPATQAAGPTPTGVPFTTIVIEGPVESIDLTVNVIVVYKQKIKLRANDPMRTKIKVGDWVHVEGNPSRDENNVIIIVVINIIIIDAPTVIIVNPPSGGGGGSSGGGNSGGGDDRGMGMGMGDD